VHNIVELAIPGKGNLPGTCRRAHGQFEAFFRTFPDAGGWKCRNLDVDRLCEEESTTLSTTTLEESYVEYAIAAWEHPNRIPDALFTGLRRHFSEAQIVELTLRITLCGFFNKFNDALGIEEEAEALERLEALTACAASPDAGHPA
jgi:hypothetical protein